MDVAHRLSVFSASCTGASCTFLYFLELACVSDVVKLRGTRGVHRLPLATLARHKSALQPGTAKGL